MSERPVNYTGSTESWKAIDSMNQVEDAAAASGRQAALDSLFDEPVATPTPGGMVFQEHQAPVYEPVKAPSAPEPEIPLEQSATRMMPQVNAGENQAAATASAADAAGATTAMPAYDVRAAMGGHASAAAQPTVMMSGDAGATVRMNDAAGATAAVPTEGYVAGVGGQGAHSAAATTAMPRQGAPRSGAPGYGGASGNAGGYGGAPRPAANPQRTSVMPRVQQENMRSYGPSSTEARRFVMPSKKENAARMVKKVVKIALIFFVVLILFSAVFTTVYPMILGIESFDLGEAIAGLIPEDLGASFNDVMAQIGAGLSVVGEQIGAGLEDVMALIQEALAQ